MDSKIKILFKKITAIVLVLATIISYFPVAVLAEDDDDVTYVNFTANFSEGGNTITTVNDSVKNIQIGLRLSGGVIFKNLAIYAEDVTADRTLPTPYMSFNGMDSATVSAGGKSLVFKKSMNAGYDATSSLKLSFPRTDDFTEYDKTIQLTLLGEYGNVQVNEVRTFTVHVVPQPEVEQFSSKVDTRLTINKDTDTVLSRYNGPRDWAVANFKTRCTIPVESNNETYSRILLYIERSCSQDIDKSVLNSATNLDIQIARTGGYTYNIVRETDGTTYIEFTRGQQLDSFDENTRKYGRSDIEVHFIYKVVEDTSLTSTGTTMVKTNTIAYVEGVNTTKSINGTEYTKGEYRYTVGREYSKNIWSNASGARKSNDYDTWITGRDIDESDFVQDLEDNNFTATFYSNVVGSLPLHNEPDECRLVVYNYNRAIDPSARYGSYLYNFGKAYLTLKSGDFDQEKVYLDNDEMSVKKIEMYYFAEGLVDKVEFFEIDDDIDTATPFFTATSESDSYTVPEGTELTEYKAVFTGYQGRATDVYIDLAGWMTDWNVDTSKLPSYVDVDNIRGITRYQTGRYKEYSENRDGSYPHIATQESSADAQNTATVNIDFNQDHYASYAQASLDNYNGKVASLGILELNKKITIKFKPTTNISNRKITRNENPQLYIQLPNEYEYSGFKVKLDGNTNGYLYIKDYHTETIDGYLYLVINIDGTYREDVNGDVRVTITHNRKLKTQEVPNILPVNIYMITDNERYSAGKTANNNQLCNSQGSIPSVAMRMTNHFSIVQNNHIHATTSIYDSNNKERVPGESEDGNALVSSKLLPLVFEENSIVKYKSQLEVYDETLNNVDFIIRLPKENNTPITTTDYPLGSTISLSLVNLNNIHVQLQKNKNDFEEVDSSNYQLLYSTEADATYNSTFQILDGNVNLSDVKTLRVIFNSEFELLDRDIVKIEYEMLMPNAEGISGATTAVRYMKQNDTELSEMEATPAYVKKGNPKGTITLQKQFEGVREGELPLGVSTLANIQFKLINMNSNEPLVLENQTTAEGIFSTDANGVATLTDVPEGLYRVIEITEFQYYDGIDEEIVSVDQGTVTPDPTVLLNKLKRGDLVINKIWEGTASQPQDPNERITFKITGQDALGFEATKDLDNDTGSVTFHGVPYGTYVVEETSELYGWYYANAVVSEDEAEILDGTVNFEAKNKVARGTLVIDKVMPSNDDVRDVTLTVTGRGISYKDEHGNTVNLDVNLTINIGDYYNNPRDGVSVVLNDTTTPTRAWVTVSNLPLATYTITEIDIPTIEGTNPAVPKYKPLTRKAPLEWNGENLNVFLYNSWRTGSLVIKKTAEPGVDLTQFKVNIKLTNSPYDTSYDRTISFPANGEIRLDDLHLGTYTITEEESDYFVARYLDEENPSATSTSVEVEDGQTSQVHIYNQAAYGYVKVLKTLEDKDAEYTVGLKFKLSGKDATGADITEKDNEGHDVLDDNGQKILGMTREITSDSIYEDPITHVKYGTVTFGPIQAGGEYSIEEVNTPEIYREIEPISVDITKHNDETHPKVISIENMRKRGHLEITTKTVPEGGPLSPIKYRVSEVTLNDDCTYTVGNKVADLDAVAGYAQLRDIYAGNYYVEQIQVPTGYIADFPQIVEVPDQDTGYVEFEITKPDLMNTTVTVEKEIVNARGEVATESELALAGLSINEIFEARITNVDTRNTYFLFINTSNPGTIKGIPAGTYEIEEVYKPKYLSSGYYIKSGDEYVEIEKVDGKYTFEVADPSVSAESHITIKIKNIVNTDFGFGGQNSMNNFNKTIIDEMDRIGKTIFYIIDEDGDAVTGAKFKFYYPNGEEVPISFDENTYEVGTDKRLVINGLPKGNYVVKCVEVPEGYLKPEDKEFVAYEGATKVTKIEVLKNKPRGNLTLTTVHTTYKDVETQTENGVVVEKVAQSNPVARSKYKIINAATGKVIRFEKTADGNYRSSKMETATDTIVLRAGSVTIKDLEVGSYEVGLVDLSEEYGVIDEEPERVKILQNETVSRNVEVKNRTGGFKKVIDCYASGSYPLALTEEGEVYVIGINNTKFLYEMSNITTLAPSLKGVKIADIYARTYSGFEGMVFIDDQGKIWTNCFGYENSTMDMWSFTCLNDIEGHPFNGLKFNKVSIMNSSSNSIPTIYALDDNGKVWFWGWENNYYESHLTDNPMPYEMVPICVSENTILEDVEIIDIDCDSQSGCAVIAVSSDGKVYAWGQELDNEREYIGATANLENTYMACISYTPGTSLNNIKVKAVSAGSNVTFFIDYDNNLWACGNYILAGSATFTEDIYSPVCLTKMAGNPLYGKKIEYVQAASHYSVCAIDSDGNYWAWGDSNSGYGFDGVYPTDYRSSIKDPVCVTNLETSGAYGIKMKYVTQSYNSAQFGIDVDGNLWLLIAPCYSPNTSRSGLGRMTYSSYERTQMIDFPKNAYFDLFEIEDMSISAKSAVIKDKSGKLWTPGHIGGYLTNFAGYDLVDYLGSELGAGMNIDGVKMYDCGYNDTLIVDNKGKLWGIGFITSAYIQSGNTTGYERMDPICITDMETIDGVANPLYNKEITYVATEKGFGSTSTQTSVAVIDSDGKIYTGGYYDRPNLGYVGSSNSDHNYCLPLQCLNDMYADIQNVKFTKVVIYDNNAMVAMDETGNLWTWGYVQDWGSTRYLPVSDSSIQLLPGSSYKSKPMYVYIPNGAKAKDVAISNLGGMILTTDNELYVWGGILGDNGSYSITPVKANHELLNGKKFVKIAAGYNGSGTGIAVDTDGVVYALNSYSSSTTVNSISALVNTDYGNVIAKDIFAGPSTLVIKDTFDDIYVLNNYSVVGGKDGTQVGSSVYRMSDTKPNELYEKEISHQINGNVVSVVENGAETVYILDSSSGEVKGKGVVDTVKAYINGGMYTVIFDGENHLYNISGNNLNLEYPDAIIEKIVYQDNNMMLLEDTEGNTYRVTNTGVIKVENVQLSKIIYQDNNFMIMNDVNGNWYKISSVAFKLLSGLDDNDAIEHIWTKRVSYSSGGIADVIFCQDSDNGLWVTIQDPTGTAANTRWLEMSGIEGVTMESLTNFQKITGYTGGPISELYINYNLRETTCLDSDDNLWIWGWGNGYEYKGLTPAIRFTNVAKYATYDASYSRGTGQMVLDKEGNLYTFGAIDANVQRSQYNNYSSIIGMVGVSYDISKSGSTYKTIINLSDDHGLGAVKAFYLGFNGAVVVTQNDSVYLCMYGSEPINANITGLEGIKDFFVNGSTYDNFYAKTTNGTWYQLRMSYFYRNTQVSQTSSRTESDMDALKLPCAVANVPLKTDPNSSEITSDISTNSLDPNRTSGLIVKDDNKLYYYTSETVYTCVSEKGGTVDMFGKQFRLIRNTEYKNR